MAATDLLELGADSQPVHRVHPRRREGLLPDAAGHGYLEMFNLFRVIACAAVLAQHSFIWTNMKGISSARGSSPCCTSVGRRSSFSRPWWSPTRRSTTPGRRVTSGGGATRQVGVPYLAWTGIYLVFSLITVSASWDEVGCSSATTCCWVTPRCTS